MTSISEKDSLDLFVDKMLSSNFITDNNRVYNIKDVDACEWIGISMDVFKFKLGQFGIKNLDFVVEKNTNKSETYYINYTTFEKIVMSSDTLAGREARNYFSITRRFLSRNCTFIDQALRQYKRSYETVISKQKINTQMHLFLMNKSKTKLTSSTSVSANNINNVQDNKFVDACVTKLFDYNSGHTNEYDLKYILILENEYVRKACINHVQEHKLEKCSKKNKVYRVNLNSILTSINKVHSFDTEHIRQMTKLLKLYETLESYFYTG
jgi:hypothetical protein